MYLKKKISLILFAVLAYTNGNAQTTKQLEYFPLQDVHLLPSPFKHAEEKDLNYLLEMDADRLLAPFLREAGLPTKKPSYTNWENTGLDGHIGGHYLSALSLMLASTGDKRIQERLEYMLANLKSCQDTNADGYIGGVPGGKEIWKEIKNGQIKAGSFSLNDKWVPLYNIHKTYAGLRDAYLYTGNKTAKAMLIKMTDWAVTLVAQLSETQIQDMLRSEHGGLNETFADVAEITQNPVYLELAKKFSQRSILTPLLHHEDKLTGMHANTQIPKVLGFKRVADIAKDNGWADAASYFWDNVVEKRSIAFGGNSVSEHFNPINDFSKMVHSVEGPETCNTYNMLRLTKMLYQTDPQSKYLDFYERGLYNHILSTQHPETGGFVYFTQIRPGHYRVYSQPHTSMWCCVGSGMENHAKYGEMIYAHRDQDLFVNLFIPSVLNWKEKQTQITQVNHFPEEAWTTIHVDPKKKTDFTLHIRKPSWLVGEAVVTINGKPHNTLSTQESTLSISRTWKKGDVVRVELPMGIHTEQIPDQSNYYSILYGPIVLGARTESKDLPGLRADDSRMGHVAQGQQIPLRNLPILTSNPENIPTLVTNKQNKPLHFTLSGLYLGREKMQMELEPFYQIHDARYIMYWPQATEAELHQIQEKMDKEERESLALASLTIDKVVCGEQQPESDHFIKEENSHAGAFDDVRWREAKGWFSYLLRRGGDQDAEIYIKYLAQDHDRSTTVYINDQIVGNIPEDTSSTDPIQILKFKLPANTSKKETVQIKISGENQLSTHKLLEIRILKK
ncbi:beta-L-arabinofuranosidase domain-containing protein [Sphingobacterium sp. LRF_L2]|uniref:beta-L-arabinofuranosidase domain-containing protein n=1 Tax=Sphingobacterium sp. LRF_L2 TaxID=3369421 RepID=UPI003F6137D4